MRVWLSNNHRLVLDCWVGLAWKSCLGDVRRKTRHVMHAFSDSHFLVPCPSSLTSSKAALFMWATQPAFSAAGYIPTIMMERPLYQREINDGLFHPHTCAWAWTVWTLF